MPALETIRGVPIARVGTWSTSTGRWVCTREQLDDAVRASRDPSFRKGVVKIGHKDPRFNSPDADGSPALGRLENYRVDASGDVLLADLVGVPAWLAQVLNSAYPSRSVEASLGVVTADGQTYQMVVTGLALLGETPPAIESLGDIASLYEQATDVDTWVAAARVAASITKDGTVMPQQTQQQQQQRRRIRHRPGRVLASVPLDDLMEAATRYARQNGIQDPWVREVWTDKVIVMGGDADDASGYGDDLFEIDWTDTDGTLAFTGPWEVRVEYQRINDQDGDPWDKPGPGVVTVAPDDGNAPATAAASARPGDSGSRPVRYVRGRGDVSASTPEEQSPVSDLAAQVRERLGLPPDASDDAVTTALEQRLGTAEQPGTGPTQTPDGGATAPPSTEPAGQPVAASAPELEQLVAQRVEAAVAPFRDQLAETSRELAERKERERNASREQLLASAVSAGKITPADRVKWAALYDKGPAEASAVEQVFASLAAGTAVPTATTPGAHTGGDAPTGDSISDAEYRALFGDEKAGAV